MTADPYQDVPAATRRRTVLRAVLGGFLSTTVLVVLYYALPLDQPLDTGAVVRVLIGLAVFAVITAWQIRTIGDLALLDAGVRLLLGAVRRGKERRSDTDEDPGPAASPR